MFTSSHLQKNWNIKNKKAKALCYCKSRKSCKYLFIYLFKYIYLFINLFIYTTEDVHWQILHSQMKIKLTKKIAKTKDKPKTEILHWFLSTHLKGMVFLLWVLIPSTKMLFPSSAFNSRAWVLFISLDVNFSILGFMMLTQMVPALTFNCSEWYANSSLHVLSYYSGLYGFLDLCVNQ